MKLYCYHVAPIDHWTGALTAEQLLSTFVKDFDGDWHAVSAFCSEMAQLEDRAQENFKKIGWEGDLRDGPYYFSVPGDSQMAIGYVIKQDNNGSTFVASPVPLPSLDDGFDSVEG